MVANEGLKKARDHVPQDWLLLSHPKDTKVYTFFCFWVRDECTLNRKKSCCQWSCALTTWPSSNPLGYQAILKYVAGYYNPIYGILHLSCMALYQGSFTRKPSCSISAQFSAV